MTPRIALAALPALLLLAAGCTTASSSVAVAEGAPPLSSARLFGDRARVFSAAGFETDLDRMLDDLAGADAVFLGETHNDDVTHQVELEVLRGLIARRGGAVVLSMEMFERDAQPQLDRYLAGEIDEPTFLRHARPWGNYRTAYRPLVELAKAEGVPVIAANFPAPLRRKIRGQKSNWDALTDDERRLVPRELFPNSAEYWARADRATRGHMGSAGGGPRTPEDRLYDGQSLWDNAMGESVADAITGNPGRIVLHVVGGFHVQGRAGTVEQTARRVPSADLRVLNVWPRFDLAEADGTGFDGDVADYMVLTASRADDVNEGRWSVEIGGQLQYRIRVPAEASDDAPVPLLVWLGDDGARDDDGLRYWRLALGDAAAVVSVDPLHLMEEEDLRLGGRWFHDDSFTSDVSRVRRGLERLVDYVSRRFPIDPERVVIAGRGTGATAVLWAAMYSNGLAGTLIAAEPRRTSGLRMAGLPGEPSSVTLLRGVTDESGADALRTTLKEYADLGLATDLVVAADGAGEVLRQLEVSVRASLGVAEMPESATKERAVILTTETPTARAWAELYVRRMAAEGTDVRLVDAAPGALSLEFGGVFSIADLKKPGALPTAPGPFGGTTVLVIPAGADAAASAAWDDLVANDPLAKRSRFLRIVLAYENRSPSLPEVLTDLAAQRRRNVLIVPAQFCADGDQMRALRAAAGDALVGMTVHWLSGLGGHLATR